MAGKQNIDERSKGAIVEGAKSGLSSVQLAAQFRMSKSQINRILKQFNERKTVKKGRKSGRPRKSTERNDRVLARIVKVDPKKTATDVAKYANEHLRLGITTRTARNILRLAFI